MKQRVAYLIIDGKQFGDENNPFEISFDVSYQGNALQPIASKFSIDNLSKDDMRQIVNNTALFSDAIRRKIEFYCGYKGNVKKIFDGQIESAHPAGQPDTSVEISAWTSIEIMGDNIQREYKNTKYLKILEDAIKLCGYGSNIDIDVRNSGILQKIASEYSVSSSSYEFLRRVICDITGFATTKNQVIFTIANNIMYVYFANSKSKTTPIEINANTGMVGIPQPNSVGVDVRVLLDVSLLPGQTINLTSELAPLYNGLYNIQNISHHGSVRDNDFYTDLQCQRVYKGE